MAKTFLNLIDDAETRVQDAGLDPGGSANQVFSSTELGIEFYPSLRHYSRFMPRKTIETMTIESRTGTATATTASALVDSSNSQFVSGDVDKIVYNSTDKTWAVITAYVSTSQLTLSKDIMASGESYEIYNADCYNFKQVNISSLKDYLKIDSVEYPKGTKRNHEIDGDILTILVNDDVIEDSATTGNEVEIYIHFHRPHFVSKLTDSAGAVDLTAGYSAGDTSMVVDGLQSSGTIEVGQEFTIAGTRGTYRVTTAATISSNEATITFYPGLESDVDDDTVVTFKASTLDVQGEDYLSQIIAARAAISKSTKSYSQVNQAITTLSNAATAVAAVAARITQAVTDIASGRTETAKISTILDTANTELDKIGARLTQAATDIAAGRTEADKVPAIVTNAATAISAIAARITQALTDIASARTAIALGVTDIASALTQMGLSDAQVDLAVTALATGNAIINTVPVGGGAPEYMGQASSDVGVAQGFMITGQGYLQNASANFNNANVDLNAANRETDAGMAKLREAQVNLEQTQTDMAINRTYIDQAVAQIRLAQGYFQEAQGYVMECNTRMANNTSYLNDASAELRAGDIKIGEARINMNLVATRMQVANAGARYEAWGRTELAKIESELRSMGGFPSSTRHPRD